jgi:hypothetical protein
VTVVMQGADDLAIADPYLFEVLSAVEASWGRDTSVDPDAWGRSNPAWGQCAATALVLQRYLGGELMRAEVGATSHYWNRLEAGREVDLTRRQFDSYAPKRIETRTRDYVLSYPDTQRRYELLLSRVKSFREGDNV